MKKIALLVAIIFSLLALAISANAEVTGSCGPNAAWSFDDTTGALTISGSGEVTSSPWSSYAASIKNITVGNGITRIERGVFYGCNAVEKMTLPFIGEKKVHSEKRQCWATYSVMRWVTMTTVGPPTNPLGSVFSTSATQLNPTLRAVTSMRIRYISLIRITSPRH